MRLCEAHISVKGLGRKQIIVSISFKPAGAPCLFCHQIKVTLCVAFVLPI